jgi:peptidyl-prolyl cis-trans isomerase C
MQYISKRQGTYGLVLAGLVLASAWSSQIVAEQAISGDGLVISIQSEPFATRGDAVITQHDFDAHLERIPQEHRLEAVADPQRIGAMLDNLMIPRLLGIEASRADLLDDPLLQAQMYQAAVVLAAETYMGWHLSENRLPSYENQARELFLTSPELFASDDLYSFSHVLVRVEPVRSELEALRRIVEIHDRISAGESIRDLAVEYSDDPSAASNRGFFDRADPEDLEENFARALLRMSEGELSDPVPTDYGWHVILLEEKHAGQLPDRYEAVRQQALELAERQHRSQLRDRLFAQVMDQPLHIEDGAVAKLLARYGFPVEEDNAPSAEDLGGQAASD